MHKHQRAFEIGPLFVVIGYDLHFCALPLRLSWWPPVARSLQIDFLFAYVEIGLI